MQCLFATLCTIHVRTCKCFIPYLRSLFMHSTYTSQHILRGSCISGGGSFQGGVAFMSVLRLTWWVPLSTRGRSCMTHLLLLWFCFGGERCEIWKIPPCDRGSWVCTHMVERSILWGDAFWVKWFCDFELLLALVPVVSSLCLFQEEPVFCFCMTVLSLASVFEGSCLVWSAA